MHRVAVEKGWAALQAANAAAKAAMGQDKFANENVDSGGRPVGAAKQRARSQPAAAEPEVSPFGVSPFALQPMQAICPFERCVTTPRPPAYTGRLEETQGEGGGAVRRRRRRPARKAFKKGEPSHVPRAQGTTIAAHARKTYILPQDAPVPTRDRVVESDEDRQGRRNGSDSEARPIHPVLPF